jgi:hypothetical protein
MKDLREGACEYRRKAQGGLRVKKGAAEGKAEKNFAKKPFDKWKRL